MAIILLAVSQYHREAEAEVARKKRDHMVRDEAKELEEANLSLFITIPNLEN